MPVCRLTYLFLLLIIGLGGFAQTRENPIVKYLAKRVSITSGELVYRYRLKTSHYEDTSSLVLKVSFFDLTHDGHTQTSLIVEDTGMIVLYDLKKTYKFFPTRKAKKEVDGKTFDYNGTRFYLPLSREDKWLPFLALDTISDIMFHDSIYNGSQYQVVKRSQRFVFEDLRAVGNTHRYVFDMNSIPVSYRVLNEMYNDYQYEEYTLLDHKFNTFDSASFFTMLADSLSYLLAAYPLEIPKPPKLLDDTVAPNFRHVSYTGDTVELSDMMAKNKVVILDFWYNACMPCRESIPTLVELYKEYKHLGLEILGINPVDKKGESIEKTISELNITYPILLTDMAIAERYRVSSYPSILILSNGNITHTHEGYSLSMKRVLSEIIWKYLQ